MPPNPDLDPIVGNNPPQDLDGDGLYEDVNGDGEFTITDHQVFFENRNHPVVQNNPELFDFARNGGVGLDDVNALYSYYQSGDYTGIPANSSYMRVKSVGASSVTVGQDIDPTVGVENVVTEGSGETLTADVEITGAGNSALLTVTLGPGESTFESTTLIAQEAGTQDICAEVI